MTADIMTAGIITQTLEQAAEADDLFTHAYDLLFTQHPEFKDLFIMDSDGSVKGSMLQTALEYIVLYTDDDPTLPQQIRGACANHEGYGVETAHFTIFFHIIRDCIATLCGDTWQSAQKEAWDKMLSQFEELSKP